MIEEIEHLALMDTNTEILGHIAKKFKDKSNCNNLHESMSVIGLLGTIVSVMMNEECSELEVSSPTIISNELHGKSIKTFDFNIEIETIGKVSEVLECFESSIELKKIDDSISDYDMGLHVKNNIFEIAKKSENRDNLLKNVFVELQKYIMENKISSKFKIKLPISDFIFYITFITNIEKHTLQ